ncbi:hypothetical protein [Clostridium pasteurianum]|uniref:Uncharacterized protein n=1 Tax=Clostridium pasteurianum BC1 TaxID=86416 RepID=R4KDD2_CLOPA|nr:hypothetical protein [Clostridium pasteurianum]AGK97630.1 hypothetical protein Clopa_2792 [Clostridium pasteurianum BC1]
MVTNCTYALWNKTGGSVNSHGDYVTTPTFIKNISGDLQPYSTAQLLKSYGETIEVNNVLFYNHFGIDTDIKIGTILKNSDDTQEYEIRKFIPWDTYTQIFVFRIK